MFLAEAADQRQVLVQSVSGASGSPIRTSCLSDRARAGGIVRAEQEHQDQLGFGQLEESVQYSERAECERVSTVVH